MFALYFGQFLLNRGLISASALEQAISVQKQTRVRLGVMAINHGFLTAAQVEEIHLQQTKIDKKFGEIAVMLGYLNNELVDAILSTQQNAHLALGQALIDQGLISYEAFADALHQYKLEYSLSDEQFESIINGSIETLLEVVLFKDSSDYGQAISDYIRLFAKNIIRFVDSGIRLELGSPDDAAEFAWKAEQKLKNAALPAAGMTAIGGSEVSFLKLASLYAQEPVEQPGEMMEASVGELLNLHNGIYLVNLSVRDVELEMEPQSVTRGGGFSGELPATAAVRVIGDHWSVTLMVSDLAALV
ncbi:hypothetical protein [Paenibacillus thalictri]|uniref:Chemotaxis protein CheX n=1 Tax=Paenibacillus thalictri TaxID=2527873 RepID=A0A4Q9E032_9BACL|nr:hypothetical protein [Paenibacillus thalictri]TBL81568.1 hypothetical protein EYB31_00710 [Paenibacillus thalictri]